MTNAIRSSFGNRFPKHRLLLALPLLAVFLPGCNHPSTTDTAQHAAIVISGDTDGWIVPCGCTANQSGGLLRRGAFLRQLRGQGPVLYADAGGAPAGDSPYQLAKFRAILAGEKLMDCAAHNLGKAELAFGPQSLRDAAASTGITFLSTNTHAADAKPLASDILILPLAGRRIAFTGVVSPAFATDAISVADPAQSITAAASSHHGQFDDLIVLAYLPDDELQKLAANLPEAACIIGGPTGQAIVPRTVGPVLIGSATNKGKFIIQLDPPIASATWTGRVEELGPTYTDDPSQQQNLHAFLDTLRQDDFPASASGLAPVTPAGAPANYRIAGSESCLNCHTADTTHWQTTAHAHAWATLVSKGFEVDSSCQQCHTTGFGLPGGFVSRAATISLVNVGCEDCHGPSLAHVQQPATRTPYDAFDQCVRCHDHENSPHFDRPTYWAKIRHPNAPAAATGAAPGAAPGGAQ